MASVSYQDDRWWGGRVGGKEAFQVHDVGGGMSLPRI